MTVKIQLRRDTAANWSLNNPILEAGEPGLEVDTKRVKYGDGATTWNNLTYALSGNIYTANIIGLTTANVSELTNLYFTNARVYSNVTAIGYTSNTYLLQETTRIDANIADLRSNLSTLDSDSVTQGTLNLYYSDLRVYDNVVTLGFYNKANIADLTTSNVSEVSNLYFTNTRAVSAFTAGSGCIIDANGLVTVTATGNILSNVESVNGLTGTVILYTANIAESGNLYYTDQRVYDNVVTLGFYNKANIADLTYSNVNGFSFNNLVDASNASLTINEIYLPAIARLSVTNNGTSAYRFSSHYGSTDNPNVYILSGTTIAFDLGSTGHPFLIREDDGNGFTNVVSGLSHVTSNGNVSLDSSAQGFDSGTLYFNVPFGTSNTYQYICSVHASMVGNIVVKDISSI